MPVAVREATPVVAHEINSVEVLGVHEREDVRGERHRHELGQVHRWSVHVPAGGSHLSAPSPLIWLASERDAGDQSTV